MFSGRCLSYPSVVIVMFFFVIVVVVIVTDGGPSQKIKTTKPQQLLQHKCSALKRLLHWHLPAVARAALSLSCCACFVCTHYFAAF